MAMPVARSGAADQTLLVTDDSDMKRLNCARPYDTRTGFPRTLNSAVITDKTKDTKNRLCRIGSSSDRFATTRLKGDRLLKLNHHHHHHRH
uniref:Uncharacterized protein n=1 Tax=Zea mays TaxID=4577 RepID=A0A804R2H2_MAIZE